MQIDFWQNCSRFMETKNILKSQSNVSFQKSSVIKSPVVSALAEAERIIAEAEVFYQSKRDEIEIEAAEKYKSVYEEAREQALFEIEKNLLEAREIKESSLDKIENEILTLSLKIARKIIGREVKQTHETILDIISTALQNTRQQEKITVRVNPKHFEKITSQSDKFEQTGRIKYIDFVADPRVENEGCIIESEVGTIDARIETQFRILERLLQK